MPIARWTTPILAFVLAAALPGAAPGQEAKPEPDDALDALIEKLGEPAQDQAAKTAKPKDAKPKTEKAKKTESPAPRRDGAEKPRVDQPKAAPGQVPANDQELDSLLEKLGETKDAPQAADSQPRGGTPPPGEPAAKPKPEAVGGKDKEIDQRLEEYTGRKRKRKDDGQERTGAVGEMIKEMRDVEKRLSQPDTSEPTRSRQKQIVKRIDEMIEQARQSGSMQRQMTMRKVRQPGNPQGQEGNQPGAQARGAPPMKPARPTTTHANSGGKDVWGHLPAELRQIMENSFKETDLPAKAEIISRYFLSVGKGRLNRED